VDDEEYWICTEIEVLSGTCLAKSHLEQKFFSEVGNVGDGFGRTTPIGIVTKGEYP
jgi:hypothetical protein